ncbi:MAG: NAD(+)/NADH kinase [Candidatus Acidiferrales bacterium]
MIASVGIISKPRKEVIAEVAPPLVAWLRARKIAVLLDEETAQVCAPREKHLSREDLASKVALLIVLGGDGTLLAAARLLDSHRVPILAVNLGSLGFLTSVTLEELYPLLEDVLAGRHQTSERLMLEALVTRAGKSVERLLALNDAVITKAAMARIIDLDVHVDTAFVGRFRADGLIVSTPTGSTAYSLAAGGPIVYPELDAFVITPICPHMLTNRPLVIPDSCCVRIELVSGDEPVHLTLDGQTGCELHKDDRVEVTKSASRVLLVRPPKKTFYEILRNKLLWGER